MARAEVDASELPVTNILAKPGLLPSRRVDPANLGGYPVINTQQAHKAFAERALTLSSAGNQLSAIHHPGADGARLGVLVIVGGPQYRVGSHRQFVHLARSLASQGIPVLRFDVAGMGDSEGEKRSFDQLNTDIHVAIDNFMAQSAGLEGVVLWGLCDGASAALIYASGDNRVQGLVLLNPWLENNEAKAKTQLFDYYLTRLVSASFWRKLLSGRLDIKGSTREFGSTLKIASSSRDESTISELAGLPYQQRMLQALELLTVPLCWILSGNDLTAKEFERQYFGDKRWKKAARHKNIKVERLDDADHTFSTARWKDWLAETTGSFVSGVTR